MWDKGEVERTDGNTNKYENILQPVNYECEVWGSENPAESNLPSEKPSVKGLLTANLTGSRTAERQASGHSCEGVSRLGNQAN